MGTSKNTGKPFVIVKIGGRPASNQDTLDSLLSEMGKLMDQYHMVLVHGGGADVSEMSRRLGLEPVFVNGLRQTSPAEMQVVEMVLAGSVNTRILRRAMAMKVRAVGLGGADGGLFIARSVDPSSGSCTGTITATNPGILADLASVGYLGVVSSVSTDDSGSQAFNVNADDAAMAAAVALKAHALIYLSDIPGIMRADKSVLLSLGPRSAEAEIAAGVISGGMIPKVRSSLGALASGVGTVVIGGYQEAGDLEGFLAGKKGTSIRARD